MTKTLHKDENNNIKGLACGCDGDPRLVTISDSAFAALGAIFDRRGCPRYTWNSGTSSCDLIAVGSRVVPEDLVYEAWKSWSSLKAAKNADTGLSGSLLTRVNDEISKLESAYNELTRTGNSSDEP